MSINSGRQQSVAFLSDAFGPVIEWLRSATGAFVEWFASNAGMGG